jgi:hypothetical protein
LKFVYKEKIMTDEELRQLVASNTQSISALTQAIFADRQAADERMDQIQQQAEADRLAANERMNQILQRAEADRLAASELARQIQQRAEADRLAADERARQLQQQIDETAQVAKATSRDIAYLVTNQQRLEEQLSAAVDDIVSMIGSLAEGQDEQRQRIDQVVVESAQDRQEIRVAVTQINLVLQELLAANQRQERINDFLLREQGLN